MHPLDTLLDTTPRPRRSPARDLGEVVAAVILVVLVCAGCPIAAALWGS